MQTEWWKIIVYYQLQNTVHRFFTFPITSTIQTSLPLGWHVTIFCKLTGITGRGKLLLPSAPKTSCYFCYISQKCSFQEYWKSGPRILNEWYQQTTPWWMIHPVQLDIVYMGKFLGPDEMNNACRKTMHIGTMNRDLTVVLRMCLSPGTLSWDCHPPGQSAHLACIHHLFWCLAEK
jgi:hypothetical protein